MQRKDCWSLGVKKEVIVVILLVIIILFLPFISAVVINEVFQCGGSNKEWIEIYNPKSQILNLSEWNIRDNYNTDDITCWSIPNCSIVTNVHFFVVIGRASNISWITNESVTYFYVDDQAIGNGLSDSSDSLTLFSTNYSTSMSYNNGNCPSNSISRNPNGGENWTFCTKTPGKENNCSEPEEPEEPEPEGESDIKIEDAPEKARFGEEIEIDVEIYRGDTRKYAVYSYVEDSDGKKVSDTTTLYCKPKYTPCDGEIDIQLKCKQESGTYKIVVEGLGTDDTEKIKLSPCNEEEEGEKEKEENGISIGDFSYHVTVPSSINLGEEFNVKVKISNNGDESKSFDVWSYIYRGSKCYSCINGETRESNQVTINIKEGRSEEITLKDMVLEAEPGDYKIKVKAQQEDLKTPKEFTYTIKIEQGEEKEIKEEIIEDSQDYEPVTSTAPVTSQAIVSESFSIVKAAPYIFISILMLLLIYLIIKKI